MLREITPALRDPTAREIRARLSDTGRARSTLKGLSLFLLSAAVYTATFIAAALATGWPLRLLLAFLNGFSIAMLFVIGHDAGHGSLTPIPWLNRLVGRLALLPSLHPYSAWVHTHNGLHHGWTNLRGRDIAYVPFSKAEYDRLPRSRRLLERIYRSTSFGLALYYLVELWWKWELFPAADRLPKGKARRAFRYDRLLVFLFAALQMLAMWWLAPPHRSGTAVQVAGVLFVGVVFPFLVWNWGIAFATYQHHTHPQTPWFADRDEWSFFRGQVRAGVRVRLPRIVEFLMNHIMDHTAHHADPRIPMYNLPAQQARLEEAYPESVVVEQWHLLSFLKTLRICQLYDYENHRWLRFDGTPTTERLLPPEMTNDQVRMTNAEPINR